MATFSQLIPDLVNSTTEFYKRVETIVEKQPAIAEKSSKQSPNDSDATLLSISSSDTSSSNHFSDQLVTMWNQLHTGVSALRAASTQTPISPDQKKIFRKNFQQLVETSVNKVVHLFNMPPRERPKHHFWIYGPREEILALQTQLQLHYSLFNSDEYALMQLDLERALALLAVGSNLGSDKTITALKQLGSGLTEAQRQDPRFRNILDNAQIHLRKIYLRRNLKQEMRESTSADEFSFAAVFEKSKAVLEAGLKQIKENPEEFEALKIRAYYQKTMAEVDRRAVDYVVERYRHRNEITLIEGFLDFKELSSQLKAWEKDSKIALTQAQQYLEDQKDNPELSYTEIYAMRAHLLLAQALFEPQPLDSLRKIQQKFSEDSLASDAAHKTRRWAWEILDRIRIQNNLATEDSLIDLVIEKDRDNSSQENKLTPSLSAWDDWQTAAVKWLEHCLADQSSRAQALPVFYLKALQSAESWLLEPSSKPAQTELTQIEEAERLLSKGSTHTEFSEEDKKLLSWNLQRLKLLLNTYAYRQKMKSLHLAEYSLEEAPYQPIDPFGLYAKVLKSQSSEGQNAIQTELNKLEQFQDKIEKTELDVPPYHAFRARLAADILKAQAKAATRDKIELNFLGASLVWKDEEYDTDKIETAIQKTMAIVHRLPPEEAATVLKEIAEYFIFEVRSINLLKGHGVQALITLLRDYPKTRASLEIRRNPELQAIIQQMTIHGRIPRDLSVEDLTIDDMTQALRMYIDKGFNTNPYRKFTYIIGTLAVLVGIDVWKARKNPGEIRRLLQLGTATDIVVNNLSAAIIIGSFGLDTPIPAHNHRYEAERAATFQLGQIPDDIHDQNIDLFVSTLGYMPAFYGASFLTHSAPLLRLVGGNALSARGLALTTGLSIPLHHHFVNSFSPLAHDYSFSETLGIGAAALLPVGLRHALNPTRFPWLYLNSKLPNVHTTLSFLHAAIGIYGAAHAVGETYPFPNATVGFYCMEFMDQTIDKVHFLSSYQFAQSCKRAAMRPNNPQTPQASSNRRWNIMRNRRFGRFGL